MECEQCGRELSPGDAFCQQCGKATGQSPLPPAGAQPTPQSPGVPPQPTPPPMKSEPGPAKTSGWAIAALVMGILGFTCLFFVGSVMAIIFGAVARHEIHKSEGRLTGNGLATAGLVLGIVVVALVFLGALIFFPLSLTKVGRTQTVTRNVPQGTATSVDATLDMRNGSLTVGGGAPSLMRGEFTYNVSSWRPSITYTPTGSSARLAVSQGGGWNWAFWRARNDWDLHFKDGVPLNLTADLHAGDSIFNLATLDILGLNVDSNAGTITADLSGNMPSLTTVSTRTNAGNVKLDFGGTYPKPVTLDISDDAGNIDLNLVGDWQANVTGTIDDSAGNITLKLPANVGVIVTATSSFGNVDVTGMRQGSGPKTWVNDKYGKTPVTMRLNVRTTAGNVHLTRSQ